MIERQFHRLDQRLAGLPADDTLYDGVPEWLELPLREWLSDVVASPDLGRRVLLRLRRPAVRHQTYQGTVISAPAHDLMITIDAVLQLHPAWETPSLTGYGGDFGTVGWMHKAAGNLDGLLVDGGSLYTVDAGNRCLTRRVDATATEAYVQTVKEAGGVPAEHLRAAWVAAYGLSPDPDKVFNEAIRAVEEIACPLVLERSAERNKATLGGVIGALKSAGHRWEVSLPDGSGDPQAADGLVGMMSMLWVGQVSRHGGGSNSRRQTQAEAEAAVHLAVTIVQWLNAGVLCKKP